MLFALFGVGAVILLYFIANEMFKNKWIAMLLALQLLCTMPFFLYMRQIRYYSLGTFFTLALFWFNTKLLEDKWNKKLTIFLNISSMLLFFSNYLMWIGSIVALGIFALKKQNREVIISLTLQIIFGVIWYFFFKPFGNNLFANNTDPLLIGKHFINYVSYINIFVFPLLLLPCIFWIKEKQIIKWVFLLLVWCLCKIVLNTIFLAPHGRYIIDVFPLAILFFGFVYEFLIEKKLTILLLFSFVLFTTTNYVGNLPLILIHKKPLVHRWPQEFAVELTGNYEGIYPQVGAYLQTHAKKDDVFIANNYYILYAYSGIPYFAPICNPPFKQTKEMQTITNPKNVRWIISFDNQPIDSVVASNTCLQQKQINLSKFKEITFHYNQGTRNTNDVDVVSRTFPPGPISNDSVRIYEKK